MAVRQRRRQKLEIWIGLLAIVSAVVLLWGYFWLTGQPLGERGYHVYALFPNAEGLERGDPVHLAGVEVGVVRSVKLAGFDRVAVRLWLERDLQIPRDSRALLQSAGVFGNKIIQLRPGRSTATAADGDTLAAGTEAGLMDAAGDIGEQAEALLAQLDRLLADTTIDQLQGSVAALPDAIRGLERLVRENSGEFAAMSRSLRQTAETLQGTIGGAEVDSALVDLETTAATLTETAESLQTTAESLASVTDKIDRGQGTLGLLVNDPGLYEDLLSTTRSLGSLTRDIQQNPGRYLKLAIF